MIGRPSGRAPQARQFQRHIQIAIIGTGDEYRPAAHAVKRFKNGLTSVFHKHSQVRERSTDQRPRTTLWEPRNKRFLIGIADTARSINDKSAALFRPFQDVGGLDILHVERRILTHQDHVDVTE